MPDEDCPPCKVVICCGYAVGAIQAFLNGYRINPLLATDAEKLEIRQHASKAINQGLKYLHQLASVSGHVEVRTDASLPATLTALIGVVNAIGARIFEMPSLATPEVRTEVGGWEEAVCDYYEHRIRDIYGVGY